MAVDCAVVPPLPFVPARLAGAPFDTPRSPHSAPKAAAPTFPYLPPRRPPSSDPPHRPLSRPRSPGPGLGPLRPDSRCGRVSCVPGPVFILLGLASVVGWSALVALVKLFPPAPSPVRATADGAAAAAAAAASSRAAQGEDAAATVSAETELPAKAMTEVSKAGGGRAAGGVSASEDDGRSGRRSEERHRAEFGWLLAVMVVLYLGVFHRCAA